MVIDDSPALGGRLPGSRAVLDSFITNRLITGCVVIPGRCLPCPGFVALGFQNVNRSFPGFTDGVPAPEGVGTAFGIRSSYMSASRGKHSSTSVSPVASTTRSTSVPTTSSSPSDCSRLILGLLSSGLQ